VDVRQTVDGLFLPVTGYRTPKFTQYA